MVESIPEGLKFNSSTSHLSIFHGWLNLMSKAQSSIDIASFYWTLTNEDTGTQEPTAQLVSGSSGRVLHLKIMETWFSFFFFEIATL